jgi:hypothetical protein
MLFEILWIIFSIILYPYIGPTIPSDLTTPLTKIIYSCNRFEISISLDSLDEEAYIKDILENSSQDTAYTQYKPNQLDIFWNCASDYIGDCYQASEKPSHCIVLRRLIVSSLEVQRKTVEMRSNLLVPRETCPIVSEPSHPITDKPDPLWELALYNPLTINLDEIDTLWSQSISKLVNIQQVIPHLLNLICQ